MQRKIFFSSIYFLTPIFFITGIVTKKLFVSLYHHETIPSTPSSINLKSHIDGDANVNITNTDQLKNNEPFTKSLFYLSKAFLEKKNYEEAAALLKTVLTIDPELLSAHIQLGHTYNHLGEIDKAIQAYENALKLQPHSANLHYNLGYTQRHIRKFDEAINHFKKALALKPDYKNAHISLAVSYWLTEQFDLSQKEFIKAWTDIKNATTPLWDGSNLKGKTIFLRGAFGLGDTIQYIRYAKELKEQGAKIYCQVQKPIANLLEHYPYVDAFVTAQPNGCDYQAL